MVSLVIPIYNEEDLVDTLHNRVVTTMEALNYLWEVIYRSSKGQ